MLRYVALPLAVGDPGRGLVVVVVFLLLHLAPGDPAALIAGDSATPEQIALIRARLHLDEPLLRAVRHLARQPGASSTSAARSSPTSRSRG